MVAISSSSFSDSSSTYSSQIRVIVVDDSSVVRGFITRELEKDPAFRVVATAGNGKIAIDVLRTTPADVMILDIEMPIMDGLTAIPKLKEIDSAVQIIMASTLTQRNAEVSLKALSLGATDYLPKPSAHEMAVPGEFQRNLVEKVRELSALARKQGVRPSRVRDVRPVSPLAGPEKKKPVLRSMPPATFRPDVIAIGSSTGGPQALFAVISAMGTSLAQPIVITQHMPPAFTTILADHITKQCNVTCVEAKDGEVLRPGHYYIAPGDFHMLLVQKPEGTTVRLVKDPQENFCRPAVDPMLRSLVAIYGGRILTVILTGMGQDGWKGCEVVVKAGGFVIAQDEASSVVWGMPGAVAVGGLCSALPPIKEIGGLVRQIASGVKI